ncbi:MAG: alpha/beta hydrolase [Anaerolineaceae bacterium]|nr:alpha/beta hydrolase [Anaerolineaceae bacterium]
MPSKASIEIRKTIVKDELNEDTPLPIERQAWEEAVLKTPLPAGIELENEHIGNVPCLWIRDEQCLKGCAIIYVHGGGLIVGSAITTRELGARLTKNFHIPVLVVDYRLAPENPYPAALEDVKTVYRELIKQRYKPEQLIFGGDSSGGGLALAAILALRDEGVCLPSSIFLISPVVDLTCSGETMITRADVDPFTSQEVLIHCAQLYAQGADINSPSISPLFAEMLDLPPMLIQVGDHEILLSDSVRLAEKVNRAGSVATLKVWDTMWHVWHAYTGLPEADEAIEEIRDFVSSQ